MNKRRKEKEKDKKEEKNPSRGAAQRHALVPVQLLPLRVGLVAEVAASPPGAGASLEAQAGPGAELGVEGYFPIHLEAHVPPHASAAQLLSWLEKPRGLMDGRWKGGCVFSIFGFSRLG